MAELSAHENIIGIKDSRGKLETVGELVTWTTHGFQVLVGSGSLLYAALEVGAVGGILGVANLAPRACTRIHAHFAAGDTAAAGRIQQRVGPLHNAVVGGMGVAGVKCALDLLGYCGGAPRPPLKPLPREPSRRGCGTPHAGRPPRPRGIGARVTGGAMGRREPRGACTVIVGCQWGDEGKGKVVDVLAGDMDVIARYQGGANAGHTVHVGDHHIVLHQVPSGVLHPGKRCLLGNGVVLDVDQFFAELDGLAERGVDPRGRIGVSTRAHVVFPYHKGLDAAAEAAAHCKIGTTGRGIGPAYEAKTGRRGVRVADLLDRARGVDRVVRGIEWARDRLRQLGADPEMAGIIEDSLALAHRLPTVATDVGDEIARALGAGKRVLLEGAQGTALDVDHGTYPYVTSSNTTAGAAAVGVGIGHRDRLGNRRGQGLHHPRRQRAAPQRVRRRHGRAHSRLGAEFGATTGRARRCGWFDAVLAAYSGRVNGLTGIAVTKLDVLDTLPELKIATGYRMDGEVSTLFPAGVRELEHAEPVYETLPGWQSPTTEARSMADLPANARAYLHRIEELVGAPIVMVSVGTRRSQVIRET